MGKCFHFTQLINNFDFFPSSSRVSIGTNKKHAKLNNYNHMERNKLECIEKSNRIE